MFVRAAGHHVRQESDASYEACISPCASADEPLSPMQQCPGPPADTGALQASGSLAAIMPDLHSEDTDVKDEAVRSLLALFNGTASGTCQELAREGIVRELLQLYDFQSEARTDALPQVICTVIDRSPNGPSQLVAALSDEDPQVVFAAAALSRHLIDEPGVRRRLLDAGIIDRLVRVLYHPSPSCCSAGLLACAALADLPLLLPRFMAAGLVSAILYVISDGCTPDESSDVEEDVSKRICTLRCPTDDQADIRLMDSCVVAQSVMLSILLSNRMLKRRYRRFATEIALATDAAEALVRGLTVGTGTVGDDGKGVALLGLPGYLLITLIKGLRACNCHGCTHLRCNFVADMANEGLLAGVGRLITPHSYTVTSHGFTLLDHVLDSLGTEDLLRGRTRPLAAALARYIEDEAKDYWKAGKALGRLCSSCVVVPPFGEHPEKLVRNMIRLLGTESELLPSGTELSYVVVPHLRAADIGPEMIKAAISGGFIQRALRILCCTFGDGVKSAVDDFGNPSSLQPALLSTLYLVILESVDVVMEIALRCGFAFLIKQSLRSTNRKLLLSALRAVQKALRVSQGHEHLQQKGVDSRTIRALLNNKDGGVAEAAQKALQALRVGGYLESDPGEAGALMTTRSRGSKRVTAMARRRGAQKVRLESTCIHGLWN